MKRIFKIILKIIYYPIGWAADLLDFIAGKIQDLEESITVEN